MEAAGASKIIIYIIHDQGGEERCVQGFGGET
jgi:hypothetical protein